MAMKTASPWWFSALFAAGLLFLFLGERPFDHIDSARMLFTGVGALLVLGVTALRLWAYSASRGGYRRVERILLICQAGVIIALLCYVTTTGWGQGLIGVDDLEPKSLARFRVPMTIVWSIIMAVSLVPLFMIEASLGTARRTRFAPKALADKEFDDAAVEWFRVREVGTSGLTVALAAALLLVTCNVATQRNIRSDVSYFKTSSPGSSTINMVKSVGEPLKVMLFFPEVNSVKNEVRGYFEGLEGATGKVVIEEHDRLLSAALAKEYRVNADGTVVLVHGDKHESIKLTADDDKAKSRTSRNELRQLDGKVNTALMKLLRTRRTAYLTVGHGELNDPDSVWAKRGMKSELIKTQLREMNYQVKDLGLSQGLANEIPEDADLVLLIGPSESLLDEELGAFKRYLERGGKLLVALDPQANAGLGALEGTLGVRFDPTPVRDDKVFMVQTRTVADHRFIVTNRFSSHASITTLSRAAARYGVVLINAGSLENVDFADGASKAKRTFVVRSMTSSFADRNDNNVFDEGSEKREQHNLVAAIEDAEKAKAEPGNEDDGHDEGKAAGEDAKDAKPDGMRAMVFADVEIFEDLIQLQVGGARAMFSDAVKWLGGEEHFAGEVVSEKDVVIQHTRNEDVLWFYSTIVGAPLVVLGFGLWFGWWRRHRTQRRAS